MKPIKRNELTEEEAARLAELEPIVEQGLKNFAEVGNALLEISDRRLYRETHSTFKEYVEEKWKLSVSRAYRMCEAAEAVKMLPNGQQSEIKNERQARELSKVPAEKREEVLAEAKERGPVTAKSIKACRERLIPSARRKADDGGSEGQAEAGGRTGVANTPTGTDLEPARVVAHTEVMPTENPKLDKQVVLFARLEPVVTKRFHKFMEPYTAEELPMVRRILRPLVARD